MSGVDRVGLAGVEEFRLHDRQFADGIRPRGETPRLPSVAEKLSRRPRQAQGQGGGGNDLGGRRRVSDDDVHAGDYPASRLVEQVYRLVLLASLWHNADIKRVDGNEYIRKTVREPAVGVKRVGETG